MGGAVFSPSPLVGGAAVGGAVLSLLSPLVWCWFLHPPPFWCCLLSPSLWCVVVFSPPPFLWCSFSASPLWVVLLALSLLYCGAAFLRCCCHSPPKLNWTPQTQHKTKRKWTYWLFMFDKLLLHFWSCFSSIFLLFHFIFLLACSLLGRFIEGIQI